jgi:hypothetical protein
MSLDDRVKALESLLSLPTDKVLPSSTSADVLALQTALAASEKQRQRLEYRISHLTRAYDLLTLKINQK